MSEPHTSQPSHLGFERAWDLAEEPNPELLNDYLRWLMDDESRAGSAIESMQWLPPGFNSFLVARDVNPDGTTRRSIQLNLYHEDHPGNEEPHGHSRNARAIWYAQPSTRQIISRYAVLGAAAPQVSGLDVEEALVVGNCIVDLKDGRRPQYTPVELGTRLLAKHSITEVAPLGSQDFASVEVHHVGFRGQGVAISVHYKGPEEVPALSGEAGLVFYKRLSPEEAKRLIEVRDDLAASLGSVGSDGVQPRPGPITMMYMKPGSAEQFEEKPRTTSPDVADQLLSGAIHTTEILVRAT